MNKGTIRYFLMLISCMTLLFLIACTATEPSADEATTVHATVVEIEKYGHAVLDITVADFSAAGYELGDVVYVRFESYESDMPYFDGYYSDPGANMLRGLSPEAKIAVCINYGSFSDETGVAIGDTAEITMIEKSGMLAVQELCSLQYSSNRTDYPDDITFSNFRAVTSGRIGDGKLYRSASPINNKYGRASYANDLISAAGITTVLNLADSNEDIEAYFEEESFSSVYYRTLYETGNVAALDLSGNFFSEEFAISIAEGLTFLSKHEPPYCIHCSEGKDRVGFTAMLLEALMGAELDEIIDDYMLSFYNYYGITKEEEPERYQVVLDINLFAMLCHVTGVDDISQLSQINLESAVTEYLLSAGMAEEDITTLKEKLS